MLLRKWAVPEPDRPVDDWGKLLGDTPAAPCSTVCSTTITSSSAPQELAHQEARQLAFGRGIGGVAAVYG